MFLNFMSCYFAVCSIPFCRACEKQTPPSMIEWVLVVPSYSMKVDIAVTGVITFFKYACVSRQLRRQQAITGIGNKQCAVEKYLAKDHIPSSRVFWRKNGNLPLFKRFKTFQIKAKIYQSKLFPVFPPSTFTNKMAQFHIYEQILALNWAPTKLTISHFLGFSRKKTRLL